MVDTKLYCSFCGKMQDEVEKLIAGPTVYICDECVVLCYDIVEEARWEKRICKGLVERGFIITKPPKPVRTSLDKFNTFHKGT